METFYGDVVMGCVDPMMVHQLILHFQYDQEEFTERLPSPCFLINIPPEISNSDCISLRFIKLPKNQTVYECSVKPGYPYLHDLGQIDTHYGGEAFWSNKTMLLTMACLYLIYWCVVIAGLMLSRVKDELPKDAGKLKYHVQQKKNQQINVALPKDVVIPIPNTISMDSFESLIFSHKNTVL